MSAGMAKAVSVGGETGFVNPGFRLEPPASDGGGIYDRGGFGPVPNIRSTVLWDGLDQEGRGLPPGIYFARIGAGSPRSSRATLVRIR
jgi:hypothetical protein